MDKTYFPFYGRTSPLSNFFASPFHCKLTSYTCAEQWLMAEKARLFGDTKALQHILELTDPLQMKRAGRGVREFDQALWDANKRDIMTAGLLHKFRQNDHCKQYLAQTGDSIIVEASYDRVWGAGLTLNDQRIYNQSLWRGENLLGFALMEVRDRLC